MRSRISTMLLLLILAPQAAVATTTYPDVIGTDINFTGIQETSSFGDPEPLFGAPTGLGNQLLFFPTTFSASAAGAGGLDQTGAQLQLMISSDNPLVTIDQILIDEFGDTDLSGIGTATTGTFASMSGVVTVTETTSGPIAPVMIGFVGTFTPSDLLLLPGDSGLTIWHGSAVIDVASVVPNATKATLSFDNDLYASSETGTTAVIQKKVVSGPSGIITIIPEPTASALLGVGLLGLVGMSVRARRQRD